MTRTLCAIGCALVLACAAHAETVTLEVTNPLDAPRSNAICVGDASLLGESVEPGSYVGATSDGEKVAVQVDDLDSNTVADEFAMVLDLDAEETVSVWVDLAKEWTGPDKADLRVSWRHDGYAALDTNMMAFGLYGIYAPAGFPGSLQWDLYGKRPDAWGLSLDALEGVNYHEDNPVAVDYLVVGDTMGLGGPIIGDSRPLVNENGRYSYRKLCDGPIRAGLEVTVTRWKTANGGDYDATIHYYAYAGHAFIDAGFALRPNKPCDSKFGVGIRRIPSPDFFLSDEDAGVLAAMGQQENIVGKTGLGIVFEPDQFARWGVQKDEDDSWVVYLNPREHAGADFHRTRLVGVWSEGGIADEDTVPAYMNRLADRFQAPVEVSR